MAMARLSRSQLSPLNKSELMRHSDSSTGADGGWYAAWRVDKLLAKLKA